MTFRSLGPLNYLHLWHDNSGRGASASWFVKSLVIRDVQTNELFYFIVQRWFAVEKGDGKVSLVRVSISDSTLGLTFLQIERLLPVANAKERREFSYILTKETSSNLSENHLWYSIFSRPQLSHFTRVQRCTCCFVLFLISMFLNIMYYDLSNATTTDTIVLGSMKMSTQQVRPCLFVPFPCR